MQGLESLKILKYLLVSKRTIPFPLLAILVGTCLIGIRAFSWRKTFPPPQVLSLVPHTHKAQIHRNHTMYVVTRAIRKIAVEVDMLPSAGLSKPHYLKLNKIFRKCIFCFITKWSYVKEEKIISLFCLTLFYVYSGRWTCCAIKLLCIFLLAKFTSRTVCYVSNICHN